MSEEKNKKAFTLSWEDFQLMGDPSQLQGENQTENASDWPAGWEDSIIRIHLEKKGRGGKEVNVIKGLSLFSEHLLSELAREIKIQCGTGGTFTSGEILIQGNFRQKIKEILLKKGFRNIKFAGG
ncbi:MAG TPA: translation initiation factor [Saprospiraceae bacterium]|nr:translation initiation factor [Saprospiraceae bacterium]